MMIANDKFLTFVFWFAMFDIGLIFLVIGYYYNDSKDKKAKKKKGNKLQKEKDNFWRDRNGDF